MLQTVLFFTCRLCLYGPNSINVPVKSYHVLFVEEVLHPFYMFQLLSISLWMYEHYYSYAGIVYLPTTVCAGEEEGKGESTQIVCWWDYVLGRRRGGGEGEGYTDCLPTTADGTVWRDHILNSDLYGDFSNLLSSSLPELGRSKHSHNDHNHKSEYPIDFRCALTFLFIVDYLHITVDPDASRDLGVTSCDFYRVTIEVKTMMI